MFTFSLIITIGVILPFQLDLKTLGFGKSVIELGLMFSPMRTKSFISSKTMEIVMIEL